MFGLTGFQTFVLILGVIVVLLMGVSMAMYQNRRDQGQTVQVEWIGNELEREVEAEWDTDEDIREDDSEFYETS